MMKTSQKLYKVDVCIRFQADVVANNVDDAIDAAYAFREEVETLIEEAVDVTWSDVDKVRLLAGSEKVTSSTKAVYNDR